MVSPQVGEEAPELELRDQHGQTVSLRSFRDSKAVLLVFYPFAFSRVCSGELNELRDNVADFVSVDVQLLGLSCDPMFSLRAFAEHDNLTFPLLSDFWPHGAVSSAYGVFDEQRGCSSRSTFVVDRDGLIRWSVHNEFSNARDLAEYSRALAEMTPEKRSR